VARKRGEERGNWGKTEGRRVERKKFERKTIRGGKEGERRVCWGPA